MKRQETPSNFIGWNAFERNKIYISKLSEFRKIISGIGKIYKNALKDDC